MLKGKKKVPDGAIFAAELDCDESKPPAPLPLRFPSLDCQPTPGPFGTEMNRQLLDQDHPVRSGHRDARLLQGADHLLDETRPPLDEDHDVSGANGTVAAFETLAVSQPAVDLAGNPLGEPDLGHLLDRIEGDPIESQDSSEPD